MPVHEPKEQRIGNIETVKLILNSRCYYCREAIPGKSYYSQFSRGVDVKLVSCSITGF